MIFELTTEERQSSTGNSQLQIIFTKPGDKTDDDKEDTDDAKTTSSSSSSLPMSRFEQNLLLQNDLNKSYQVQQWLNNLESSSNSAVEDTSEEMVKSARSKALAKRRQNQFYYMNQINI
ncbi:unnamed protein product [Rotaria sordida]|uniref:Uncharacterized protein n=1 Tax=Rotaria sordida TaxID=392033 RepID=A0A819R5A7_9BILA|nr:unnamed protein product [Rotaria sordida]CAF4220591.1 unnamed protein product [Rotaria sordida]